MLRLGRMVGGSISYPKADGGDFDDPVRDGGLGSVTVSAPADSATSRGMDRSATPFEELTSRAPPVGDVPLVRLNGDGIIRREIVVA